MNAPAWSCNECDTNNSATNDTCRNCDAERTVAAGALTQTRPAVPTAIERPVFVQSRHVAPPLPTRLAPTAPPRAPTPDTPPPRPARPPNRTLRRVVLWTMLVIGALFGVTHLSELLPDGAGSSPSSPSETAVACPSEVAQWLPNADDAELVASYTSPQHAIFLCRTADGGLYYDGRYLNQPVTSKTHLSIPATATASGFVAVNGDYTYEITGAEVVVTKGTMELSRNPLTRTGP